MEVTVLAMNALLLPILHVTCFHCPRFSLFPSTQLQEQLPDGKNHIQIYIYLLLDTQLLVVSS